MLRKLLYKFCKWLWFMSLSLCNNFTCKLHEAYRWVLWGRSVITHLPGFLCVQVLISSLHRFHFPTLSYSMLTSSYIQLVISAHFKSLHSDGTVVASVPVELAACTSENSNCQYWKVYTDVIVSSWSDIFHWRLCLFQQDNGKQQTGAITTAFAVTGLDLSELYTYQFHVLGC